MALIVEDGTGKVNANAYVDVATVNAYATLLGRSDWLDLDTADKEAAIARSTIALDAKYGSSFIGVKGSKEQSRAWPRQVSATNASPLVDPDGYDIGIDEVPAVIMNVACEIAFIESVERFLSTGISRDDLISSETVGPISTSWDNKIAPTVKQYPHIDSMLVGYAGSASGLNMVISLTAEEINQCESVDVFDYPEYFNLVKVPI